MDRVNLNTSVATRIAAIGYNSWQYGSYLGRFEKMISGAPTDITSDTSTRCAITAP